MSKKFHLFSVYGIEAEYMIVNRQSLKAMPIADKILAQLNGGEVTNEVELGPVAWSNELVNHVLEVKCAEPAPSLLQVHSQFHESILKVNRLLEAYDAVLMPTAMHPWFDPQKEMELWPHGQRDIYSLYHAIFDCRGHGWSNLQSVHINLPYANEAEFKKLHTAIRAILPIIPYFAASSPFYGGEQGAFADNRLAFYEKNQIKVPSIIGNIIPECVSSTAEYKDILKGIYKDISSYDEAKTLQNPWLNSRAAIPKFDVGAIEIRLMDIQESPYMDLCLVQLFVHWVRVLTEQEAKQQRASQLSDSLLRRVYDESKKFDPKVFETEYFDIFESGNSTNWELFRQNLINESLPFIDSQYHRGLKVIAEEGSLSNRLTCQPLSIELYRRLVRCLAENGTYE